MPDLRREREVPLRRSLLLRLLSLSVVVCALSVVATAWLVVETTAVQTERTGQTLEHDALVYGTLLDFARTHADWEDVDGTLEDLADRTGYRIVLTGAGDELISDSAALGPAPAPAALPVHEQARTVIDPFAVDQFLLLHSPDPVGAAPAPAPVPAQVSGDTAGTAWLFVAPHEPSATPFLDLSDPNRLRIVQILAFVLIVAAAVSLFVGLRMTRPLRALTSAAHRMGDGDLATRVDVGTTDEIGALATAFNTLAANQQRQEELRSDMVSDIAHELRTPLSNIRGWLEAAQDGVAPLDDALVGSLHEEAILLQHVVDDLRDLALADAGELRLHPEPTDLGALADQVVAAQRAAADAAGVHLRAVSTEPALARADPLRLRQVLTNLVSNAVRHTPPGGSVTVEVTATPDGWAVQVADTGSGIAVADLPRVFDRFWRSDRSRTRGTGGSGLGLAIARNIVELHGGTITVQSVMGDGSTFLFTLPDGGPPPGPHRDRSGTAH